MENPATSRTKILAIDDNPDIYGVFALVLKRFIPECSVISALSGTEGIDKAVSEMPDTILLDIEMPGPNGFEVCRILKTRDETKHIPVIMVTAYKDADSRLKGLECGADAFLTKPMDNAELVAQVNVALRIKRNEDILRGDKDRLEKAVGEKTEALLRVNRALATRSECNREIVRSADEADLLGRVCRIVLETGGYRLAWIGHAENDEAKTVRPVARHGHDDGYIDTLDITWADTERGHGPTGVAIRTRRPAAVRHIPTSAEFRPWRTEALKRGYASCVALPLLHKGDCIGSLNIYAVEPDAFDADEQHMLMELADDLAHGIIALRMRQKRAEAERALKESEKKYRTLFESIGDAIFIHDAEANILDVNPEACARYGYTRKEFLGMKIGDLDPPENAGQIPGRQAFPEKGRDFFETVHWDRDGNKIVNEVNSRITDYAGGEAILSICRDVTDRKRIEAALQESETQKKAILDGISANIAFVNENLEILWVNRAAAESVGKTPKETLGFKCHELWADPDAPCDDCPTIKALKTGKSEHATIHTSEGTVWEERGEPVFDPRGNLLGVVQIAQDITEGKRAERLLRENASRMNLALEGTDQGIWDWNVATGAISFDKNWPHILGYEPGETDFDFEWWEGRLHPDSKPAFEKALDAYLKGEERYYELEHRIRDKSGGWKWIWARGICVEFDETGGPLRFIGTQRDITVNKQAENLLRSERDKLRGVFDAVGDGMFIVNTDYVVEYQNRAITRQFGKTRGAKCHRAFHGLKAPCDYCLLHEAVRFGKIRDTETGFSNGTFCRVSFAPFTDADGETKAIVLISDVTERKKIEADAMRTAHLASLGELAAGVAHEINNPMTGIISIAEILKTQVENHGDDPAIPDMIISEGERVAEIVRNLLSFAHQKGEEFCPVHVSEIVADSLALVKSQMSKNGIRFHIDISPGLPMILAHSGEIQQVFLNLLSNAAYALNRKYPAAHEKKTIEIRGETVETNGAVMVRIIFHDRGTGVGNKVVDKLCNPFFSTKPQNEGTGLGLSISHGIIEKHRGKISFESAEGKYMKVMVDIPAMDGADLRA